MLNFYLVISYISKQYTNINATILFILYIEEIVLSASLSGTWFNEEKMSLST